MDARAKPPLAVDLDGTLIRSDLFTEAMLRLAFAKPWKIPLLLLWLTRGRAYAKARLAEAFPPDAASLPYDDRIVQWLREERAQGREIALATASDIKAAQAVADHVGVFDRVFASDGRTNLKSRRKGEALAQAYPMGFVYAGNEHADLKVWAQASQAVVCNAGAGFTRHASQRFKVERTFERETRPWRRLLTAMRPRHWAKNLLVFVPMLAGQGWQSADAWINATAALAALCLVASAIYLMNDAADIEADRQHPRKRDRPFASGAASPALGLAVSLALLAAGLSLGVIAGVGWLVAAYVVAASLYTFALKRVVLVDVFVLAALYSLRILVGGVATGFMPSAWLLAFTGFFFLSLALVKRAAEVDSLQTDLIGRGYRADDGPVLKRFGVAVGAISTLVLALYLQEPENAARYSTPYFLWLLPGAILFWLARVWLKVERREMHDDPLLFALNDPWSWITVTFAAASFLAASLI